MEPMRPGFMPYPVSRLSPQIVPNDLTTFKSRGVSAVNKDTAQRLEELRKEYVKIMADFNWNKLIYESEFKFEPVIGQTCYLYDNGEELKLSMIGPEEWNRKFVGSFELGVDAKWHLIELGEGIDPQAYFEGREKAARGA
jgi:hypothetical protein